MEGVDDEIGGGRDSSSIVGVIILSVFYHLGRENSTSKLLLSLYRNDRRWVETTHQFLFGFTGG